MFGARLRTRGAAAGLALAALLALSATVLTTPAGALPGPVQSSSMTLSSLATGTRPVALTLTLQYEMQCGYPGPGPVVVTLPRGEAVPVTLAASAVLVDGHHATSVSLSGRAVSVGLAPEPQIMCDVIGPGRLVIAFTRSAGLGNPMHKGSYAVLATRGSASFSARFTIA